MQRMSNKHNNKIKQSMNNRKIKLKVFNFVLCLSPTHLISEPTTDEVIEN